MIKEINQKDKKKEKDINGNCKISGVLNKQNAIKHLSRMKGQIEGIIKMIEKEDCCTNVINQCRAIRGGVCRVEEQLLEAHLRTCMVDAIKNNDLSSSEELIKELISVYKIGQNNKK